MSNIPTDNPPPEENKDVIADYYDGVKQMEMEGHETGIKKARNALFVTAVLVTVSELITARAQGFDFTPLIVGIALAEGGVFAALAFWTKKKPFSAIVVGLILFLLLWAVVIYVNGVTGIYSGIIFRVIVIVYLAQAIKPARAWEQLKKQN